MVDQLVPARRRRQLHAAPVASAPSSEAAALTERARPARVRPLRSGDVVRPMRPSALGWTVPPESAVAAAFLPIDGHEPGHDAFWSESDGAWGRRGLRRLRRSF